MNPGQAKPYAFLLGALALVLALIYFLSSSRHLTPEARRAVSVATEEARRRGWERIEVTNPVLTDGHWTLTVWSLPKAPGGYALVEVSSDGALIRFSPGL